MAVPWADPTFLRKISTAEPFLGEVIPYPPNVTLYVKISYNVFIELSKNLESLHMKKQVVKRWKLQKTTLCWLVKSHY